MNINEEWIKKEIAHLHAHIGIYKPDNNFLFEPTKEFYKSISNGNFKSINIAIQQLSSHISCNVNPSFGGWITESDYISNKQIIENNETNIEGKAGLIYSNDRYNSKIQINERYKSHPIIIGAILAHEITHHSLMEKKLYYYKNKDKNENFTDLAAIFFGFGKLLLNGYLKSSEKIGYISHENLAYSNIKICNFRNIPIPKLRKNLTEEAIKIINKSFSYYKKREKRLKIKTKRKKRLFKFKKRIKNIFKPLSRIFKINNKDKKQSEEFIIAISYNYVSSEEDMEVKFNMKELELR
ncbi:MAG: hypothetical protein ACQER9_04975 [Nanobdellota archaeon]